MVSTRRKSYVAGTAGAGQDQSNGESDTNSPVAAAVANETPSARLSARKSIRSRASQSESDVGTGQSTPLRRSRRVSNSSVGSNDEDSDVTAAVSSVKKRRTKAEETKPATVEPEKERVQLPPITESEEVEEPVPLTSDDKVDVASQKETESKPAIPEPITLTEDSSEKKGEDVTEHGNENSNAVPEKPKDFTVKTVPSSQRNPVNAVDGQKQKLHIPRGKPKSGRVWKEPRTNPRTMYKDAGVKMPLSKVLQLREEKQRVKEIQNRLKEEQRRAKEELRRRQEMNRKKREENEKKGEVIQVIRNSAKLKRMKKKQLKLIQKRDTTNM